ncbi:MAG: phosphate ABC transporter substrate-binding protein PstS [Nevskia sp.]|nr:phosphate ABC transporter substrate-binding protein PstS [Nevskia sp.]
MNACRFARTRALLAGVAVLPLWVSASAADVTGAGSTFVAPVMKTWVADYQRQSGQAVEYSAVGSSAGIKLVTDNSVTFGASDMPLESATLKADGLVQFPVAIGGVVPVVNIEGVKTGPLKLTGAVLADIFMGRVASWDDGAITALNPGLRLPHQRIVVVHRKDGSGTTYNFANYLSQVSDGWRSQMGAGMLVKWPVGLEARHNGGVADLVKRTPGAIGYVELAYVNFFNLTMVLVKNNSGAYVEPSSASFAAAAAGANWRSEPDFRVSVSDAPEPAAYPITAFTFVLIHANAAESPDAKAALDFFRWIVHSGQKQAVALGYAPLPAELVDRIGDYWLDRMGVAL